MTGMKMFSLTPRPNAIGPMGRHTRGTLLIVAPGMHSTDLDR